MQKMYWLMNAPKRQQVILQNFETVTIDPRIVTFLGKKYHPFRSWVPLNALQTITPSECLTVLTVYRGSWLGMFMGLLITFDCPLTSRNVLSSENITFCHC